MYRETDELVQGERKIVRKMESVTTNRKAEKLTKKEEGERKQ